MPPPPPPVALSSTTSGNSELNFSAKTKKNLDNLKMLDAIPLGDLRDILSQDLNYSSQIKNLLIKMNNNRSKRENERDLVFWMFAALKT